MTHSLERSVILELTVNTDNGNKMITLHLQEDQDLDFLARSLETLRTFCVEINIKATTREKVCL